jgi:hypothetical protein
VTQPHDFGLGHERHDNLDEFLAGRIEDHLHIFRDDFFRDFLRHDQTEHFNEQLNKVWLTRILRQVHHRSRVTAGRE